MKTTIIKCQWNYEWNQASGDYEKRSVPSFSWVNVNEIKTLSRVSNRYGEIIGSGIFYMGGVGFIHDNRTPDELMNYINNL